MEHLEKEKELDRVYHNYPRSVQHGSGQKRVPYQPPSLQTSDRVMSDDIVPSDIDSNMFSPVARAVVTKHNKDRKTTRKTKSRSRSN